MSDHSASSIRLEHLIALSDEMAALARSGVPLERGLANFGRDVPGELGRVARRLAERLQRGDSLAEVLAQESASFPAVYRTVVEAGLRTGRLASALEGLATSGRRLAELRRSIGLAMLYPLSVTLLGCALMVFFVTQLAPRYQEAYTSLRIAPNAVLDRLAASGESAHFWGPAIMLAIIVAAAAWWWVSGRSILVESGPWTRAVGWIPGVGKLLVESRIALFCEVLAVLVEHETPLPEAIRLAAAATGDRPTAEAAEVVAQAAARGEPLTSGLSACPPVLSWLLTTGCNQPRLAVAARQTSEHFSLRAKYRLEQVRLLLPLLGTLCVAGVVTLCYALALFIPWSHLLRQLG